MNFKIAYFAFAGNSYGGVEQKIIAQYDALIKIKSEVFLYLVCTFKPKDEFLNEIKKRGNVFVLQNSHIAINNPIKRRKEKFQLITNILKGYNPNESLIYLRYPGADYLFNDFLKLNNKFKIITEHQQIENTFKRFKFNGNYLTNILETIWGKSVRKRIAAFVCVTPEILDYEIRESRDNNKMGITIGNGINVTKYEVRKPINTHPEIIKVLFVGAGYRTHGLYRLIKSIAEYLVNNHKYNVLLKVAGNSKEMDETKTLAEKLNLRNNVEFYGEQNNIQLNKLFDWADIAVGSLAIHRKGLIYTSELKAREYFSRGLPFFWSTKDTDFPDKYTYIFEVPAGESIFNFNTIIDFVNKIREDNEHPQKMREYAIQHLDWSVKVKKLMDFFYLVDNI